jgi:hypothetical protein
MSGGSEENHEKYVRIVRVPAEIRIGDLSNTSQEPHHLRKIAECRLSRTSVSYLGEWA